MKVVGFELSAAAQRIHVGGRAALRQTGLARWEARHGDVDQLTVVQARGGLHDELWSGPGRGADWVGQWLPTPFGQAGTRPD